MRLLLAAFLALSFTACTEPEAFIGHWTGIAVQTGSCQGLPLPAEYKTDAALFIQAGTNNSDLRIVNGDDCVQRFGIMVGSTARLLETPLKCPNVLKRRVNVVADYKLTLKDSTHLIGHKEYTLVTLLPNGEISECGLVLDMELAREAP